MRILIINPPFYRLQNASLMHYPPGPCYLAAVLEKNGHAVTIYNADYDPRKKTILGNTNHINIKALLEQDVLYQKRLHDPNDFIWREIESYLKKFSPEFLIISVFNTTLTAGEKIARLAKKLKPDLKVAFEGLFNRGLHCAVNPAQTVSWEVMDFALRGEPELSAAELVSLLLQKEDNFESIKGLSWKRKNGGVIHNPERELMENLDQLPFPARHALDGFEKMPAHTFQGIYGSRGCPFDCVFCGCHVTMGRRPRVRSAENMVAEIEEVKNKYGTRYFYLCDDIFFIQKERAIKFCQLLIEKKINIYWSAQTRAEMIDEELLNWGKKAGLQHVAVGVEVGNPQIRELIKKGNTIEDVKECAKKIKRQGLYMAAFCMVGLPWEGQNEIEETVKLIEEIDPYIVYPYMPTPSAGTALYQQLAESNPEGLSTFRDRCHLSTASLLAEQMSEQEKEQMMSGVFSRLVRHNRKKLFLSIPRRLPFYLSLARDMNFFKKPAHLWDYLRDFFRSSA